MFAIPPDEAIHSGAMSQMRKGQECSPGTGNTGARGLRCHVAYPSVLLINTAKVYFCNKGDLRCYIGVFLATINLDGGGNVRIDVDPP